MTQIRKLRYGSLFSIGLIIFLIVSCRKDTVTIPATETDVIFLAHKGGGDIDYNPSHIDNTLPAVKYSSSILQGVEEDIQMSLDGTIWLFHDADFSRVSTPKLSKSLILSKDADISKIITTNALVKDRLYKLAELVDYWNSVSTPFYLSLHLKLDFPADTINHIAIGGEAKYLSKFADNLSKIIPSVKNPGKIIIEVYDATFCKKIHSLIPGIKVCLIKEVTFPKQVSDAMSLGYDGVSCMFSEPTLTTAEVTSAKNAGLIVQLWTPNQKQDLTTAFNYHPTILQTDNLDALTELNVTPKK